MSDDHMDDEEGICPICLGPTDPDWYCSEGYCPECCTDNDSETHEGDGCPQCSDTMSDDGNGQVRCLSCGWSS